MKWLLGGLLLLNLAVAAYFIAAPAWLPGADPSSTPIQADKLSLRSQARVTEAPGTQLQTAAETGTEALCVEWRGLTLDEFARVREQLKSLVSTRPMSFREIPVNTRHWVIFPPLPSARSASEKLSELTAAGVQDVFVVREAAWRNALSLGLYANAEAAARRVRELEARGVLGTRVELLPRQGTDFYFLFRSHDLDMLKSLSDLRQPFPGSRLTRVACPS